MCIRDSNIVRTDYATFVEYVTAGVVALLLVLLATFAPYWLVGIAFVVFWTGTGYASYFAFTRHLQLWDVSWILLVASLTGFHAVFNRFAKEFFEKQKNEDGKGKSAKRIRGELSMLKNKGFIDELINELSSLGLT